MASAGSYQGPNTNPADPRGRIMSNKLRDELKDIAQVDQEPSLEGRQLLMVLSPLKKKS